ncbi:dipeptidase [Roseibacterium sp. SDUM158016]|uniref:dipeptidase n=1 Tax=Roseicyclus sediminis TaxID=2980997 RepID=UPI0021CEE49A|nr:dipeptidase [Roseibacterium sp. SDUM158016]MCU4654669.1 dipeptidase [Roseibacterium sp. SDUM158016]
MIAVFDGHNDALLRLSKADDPVAIFRDGGAGHLDLPKARAGGMEGGFFALFSPTPDVPLDFTVFDHPPYDVPVPGALPREVASHPIARQIEIAQALEAAGLLAMIRTRGEVGKDTGGALACVLHLEGADCLGPEGEGLETLFDAGLRSLGPVWSRPNAFAHGVPFRTGSDGDTGPGLTQAGRALVRSCRDLGMVVDCSHITMRGFWDIGEEGLPLVATHSNACAISMSARNLTDAQLRAIGESGGMAGLNFGTMFLNPDGRRAAAGALDHAVRHLAHMVETAGEAHVGLGSDFDGAPMPEGLGSAAELQVLVAGMEAAGFGADLIDRICHRNWRDFLARTLPRD